MRAFDKRLSNRAYRFVVTERRRRSEYRCAAFGDGADTRACNNLGKGRGCTYRLTAFYTKALAVAVLANCGRRNGTSSIVVAHIARHSP